MADGYLNFDTKINASGFNKGVSEIGKSLSGVGSKLTNGITKPALAAATAVGGIVLASGFSRMTAIDSAKVKLEALGNSAENVAEIMDNALASVQGTAYNMDEAATTAAAAVAAGIQPGKDLERYLSSVADAASIAGISMGDMGTIFNKVTTQNKATNEVLQQMAEKGVPIYQWLADEIGVAADEVFDMASKGEIDLETFRSAVEKNIGGAAKVIGSKTITGAFTNVQAAIARIGANLIGTADDADTVAGQLLSLINWVTEQLGGVEDAAKSLAPVLGGAFSGAVDFIKQMVPYLASGSEMIQGMSGPARQLAVSIDPIVSKFKELSTSQQIGMLSSLVAAGPVLKATGKAFSTISTLTGNWLSISNKAFSGVAKGIATFKGVAGPAFTAIGAKVGALASGIGSLVASAIPQLAGLGGALSGFMGGAMNLLGKFLPIFVGAFNIAVVVGAVVAGLGLLYSAFGDQIDSIIEMMTTQGPEIITGLVNGITTALPRIIEQGATLLTNLMAGITANIPALISGAFAIVSGLASGIASQIPVLIPAALNMIVTLVTSLLSNIGQLVDAGVQVIEGLADGLEQNTGTIVDGAASIITSLATAIITNLPKIIQAGIRLMVALGSALIQAVPQVVSKIPIIVNSIKNAFTSVNWSSVGRNIISGIASGLSAAGGALWNAVKGVLGSFKDQVLAFFGIHSPSRWGIWVGRMIDAGLASGIEKGAGMVEDATADVQKAVESIQGTTAGMMASGGSITYKSGGNSAVSDLLETSRNLARYANRPIEVVTKIGTKTAARTLAEPIQSEQDRLAGLNSMIGGVLA